MIELLERRVLICAPLGKDAELASKVMTNSELVCCICEDWHTLLAELKKGAGLILTVEEMLTPSATIPLFDYLSSQAPWSDLPIIVLTKNGGLSQFIKLAYENLGNLTLLERPIRAPTLVSAAKSALRARMRQYEIRQYDQRKDEFLAMLAHELRNPLAPISSAAQILKYVAAEPQKVKNTVEIIDRQVVHLTNLIDDLLDVARVTRGLIKLEKEPLDMRTLVSHAVEQINPHVNAKSQQLSLEVPVEPVYVLGDKNRLIQVIANLLNNATKYTPNGGNISIAFRIKEDEVALDIVDDGIGISADVLPHIFDLFSQAKRTSDRSQGGLGLGLALVKSLVSSHGGSVSVLSRGLGAGSSFSISLPRLPGEHLTERSQGISYNEYSTALFKPLRLLIVDDNRDAADSLASFLENAGHTVFSEYTAKGALAKVSSVCPHIYILDIGLPDMDGNELVKNLRALPETGDATFIAITGYGQQEDKEQSLVAGFHYHFVKPVDPPRLLNIIAAQVVH